MKAISNTFRITLTGMLCLAVAMGIGRFAFTPLLPMMMSDGLLNIPGASLLASANYLGYMVGALLCAAQPWLWRRLGRSAPVNGPLMVRAGLLATTLVTLGMALQVPTLWPVLRFAAGLAGAFVMVYTSGWCLSQLAQLDAGALGGVIYAGPGVGIVVSGLAASAMVASGQHSAMGWLAFGLLAAVLTFLIWPLFTPGHEPSQAQDTPTRPAQGAQASSLEIGLCALTYGCSGFGYIITATFLPVIARQALPGSAWLDMFWPTFGAGVVTGALLATRVRIAGDLRLPLAACYGVQAVGVALSIWSPTLWGLALGSLLLGLPFTAVTFFTMQEARRLAPTSAPGMMGLLTGCFGIGQVVGPPLVAWMLSRGASQAAGFHASLEIATAALVLGMVILLSMVRLHPIKHAQM